MSFLFSIKSFSQKSNTLLWYAFLLFGNNLIKINKTKNWTFCSLKRAISSRESECDRESKLKVTCITFALRSYSIAVISTYDLFFSIYLSLPLSHTRSLYLSECHLPWSFAASVGSVFVEVVVFLRKHFHAYAYACMYVKLNWVRVFVVVCYCFQMVVCIDVDGCCVPYAHNIVCYGFGWNCTRSN